MALNSLICSRALKTFHDAEDTNVSCVGLQGLSEAKMELRRKEHVIRQVSKQMSYMESEKNALVDRLGDAERAMTAAARLVELRRQRANVGFHSVMKSYFCLNLRLCFLFWVCSRMFTALSCLDERYLNLWINSLIIFSWLYAPSRK